MMKMESEGGEEKSDFSSAVLFDFSCICFSLGKLTLHSLVVLFVDDSYETLKNDLKSMARQSTQKLSNWC